MYDVQTINGIFVNAHCTYCIVKREFIIELQSPYQERHDSQKLRNPIMIGLDQ
jgi:hypothetical protein